MSATVGGPSKNAKPCSGLDCAVVRELLARWYERRGRDLPWRRSGDPYAIWVSEVMLQQTQVQTVIPYYLRFMELFPDIGRLARADEQLVLKTWEGLGYYSRARHLHRAAQALQAAGAEIPGDWKSLRALPGVGDYIAAAVLSIAFAEPYAAVDGNVKRVLARLLRLEAPANAPQEHGLFQQTADRLLDRRHPGRHNQALMELGATVCQPRGPLCASCPLAGRCLALQSDSVDQYPRRIERRRIGERLWAAAVIIKQGRVLLVQRPATGLLAGLWEFPAAPVEAPEDPARACSHAIRTRLGLKVQPGRHLALIRHAYTHFKLRLEVYLYEWQSGRVRLAGPGAFQWMHPAQIDRLPLHGAARKVLAYLDLPASRLDCSERCRMHDEMSNEST